MTVAEISKEEIQKLKEARDRGVAYLDENHPGWREKINPFGLDMGHESHCILGQLDGGDYDDYVIGRAASGEWAQDHGFFIAGWDWDYLEPRYNMLTFLWKEIL